MENYIQKFKDFDKTLYVFDFDDTLAHSPKFETLASIYLTESKSVKELLDDSTYKIGVDISKLKFENGRIYIEDPREEIKVEGNWVRKGKRIYLTAPTEFDYSKESFPKSLKEPSELYKEVKDKCIITARPEGARELLEETLLELGLDMPKFGIWMRPDFLNNAGQWKGFQICEIAKKFNFNSVVFFDDNPKYIRKAKKVVEEIAPELKLKTHKVN